MQNLLAPLFCSPLLLPSPQQRQQEDGERAGTGRDKETEQARQMLRDDAAMDSRANAGEVFLEEKTKGK